MAHRFHITDPKSLPGVRVVLRLLPLNILKHWLYPFLVRGRRRRYNAQAYFDSWYKSGPGVSDGSTISPTSEPLYTRYHYNTTENSILRWFAFHEHPAHPRVLDIGSGAGHWIDFYYDIFAAHGITGIDLSTRACEALRLKYEGKNIEIHCADVSASAFNLGQYDIINAIGVMFHIVDDAAWMRAIQNLARSLAPKGTLVVGGQFGWLTRDVQFHHVDSFNSWQELHDTEKPEILVNKRIRSIWAWRRAADDAGLRVAGVIRTASVRGIPTPENHILLLEAR